MGITLITDISCSIDTEKIIQSFTKRPENKQIRLINDLLQEMSLIAKPKAVFSHEKLERLLPDKVAIKHAVFTSKTLFRILKDQSHIAPFLATSGHELEKWSEKYDELLTQFWINVIKNEILSMAIEEAKFKLHQLTGWRDISIISPGSINDWGPEEQQHITSIFEDHLKNLGIKINNNHVIYPPCSLSGIFFICPDAEDLCAFCHNIHCTHRKAPPHEFLKK